jgi:hypothetical protein
MREAAQRPAGYPRRTASDPLARSPTMMASSCSDTRPTWEHLGADSTHVANPDGITSWGRLDRREDPDCWDVGSYAELRLTQLSAGL